ncbi:MAG: crosslink repair DNA glycosylase YcaQ family protein [Mycobacteriales bacterium]|nr:crosslink repair DNA glycosylase YcaQ family protein [Mycobacteriales bacterium]
MQTLPLRTARQIALAAQGFADPLPTGAVDARHLRRVVARTSLIQIDSVNVFARAHHLPPLSRLGAWPVGLLDDLAFRRRELFEYWGHEASYLPVALHPHLRWRMARAEGLEEGWGGPLRVFRDRPDFVEKVYAMVEERGPVGAGALRETPRGGGSWWGWDDVKKALEYLFWSGRVTTSRRTTGFERLYDVTERVIPASVLALPTPSREEAQRELMRVAARAHGVGTERDLRDYFRLRPAEAKVALASLVEDGELEQVAVEGWRDPAYLWPGTAVPRTARRSTLLSPFDPLVFERSRTSRLFGFDYRIEIYVPAPKRVYGYYILPFLHDEGIRARVDLKSDRKAGVLQVLGAWVEPKSDVLEVAEALAVSLQEAAAWQGLSSVAVSARGDLAPVLAPLVR